MTLAKDFSLSAVIAGFITVLVGFTSAGVIVFQAAQALGASSAEIGSWMWALGLGMGLTSAVLSWRYKMLIALPLFIVTMASQNVPGVATIRAFGYDTLISPLIDWTGVATLLLAPFGAFAINLAAITAAISMGREAHEDPDKRYVAAIAVGIFYILIGIFGATVGSLFAALPEELILAIAGLALLGTIGKGLAVALADEKDREAALITFLVTASGMALFGIGSAFWGLAAGGLATAIARSSIVSRLS